MAIGKPVKVQSANIQTTKSLTTSRRSNSFVYVYGAQRSMLGIFLNNPPISLFKMSMVLKI